MSLSHSPKIVTDGLILYLDAANTDKSWKGEPTTNLAVTSGAVTDWTGSNIVASVTRAAITANYKYSLTSTTGGAWRMLFNLSNLVDTETYALSFKYELVSAGATFAITDWNDTFLPTNLTTSLGDNVYYAEAVGTRATYTSVYRFMDLTISANSVVHIWDIQLENKTYATPYVAYQRTNTQAILDMVGGNTLTETNLTHDAANGGSLVFDGVDGHILVASDGTGTYDLQTFSVSLWVNMPSIVNYGILWSYDFTSHVPPYYAQQFRIDANGTIYCGFNIAGSGVSLLSSAGIISAGVWNNIVLTFTTGSQEVWVNGVSVGTSAHTGTMTYYAQEVWIGRGNWAYTQDEKIGPVMFHNRVLTDAEIMQNYKAHKGRYGL